MTPARANQWKRTREQGRAKYVLLAGMLWWGGFMTICMSVFQYIMHRDAFDLGRTLGINLPIYMIGGLLFGLWSWSGAERAYRRHLDLTINQDPGQDAGSNLSLSSSQNSKPSFRDSDN
jgi:hypothetical protein